MEISILSLNLEKLFLVKEIEKLNVSALEKETWNAIEIFSSVNDQKQV